MRKRHQQGQKIDFLLTGIPNTNRRLSRLCHPNELQEEYNIKQKRLEENANKHTDWLVARYIYQNSRKVSSNKPSDNNIFSQEITKNN